MSDTNSKNTRFQTEYNLSANGDEPVSADAEFANNTYSEFRVQDGDKLLMRVRVDYDFALSMLAKITGRAIDYAPQTPEPKTWISAINGISNDAILSGNAVLDVTATVDGETPDTVIFALSKADTGEIIASNMERPSEYGDKIYSFMGEGNTLAIDTLQPGEYLLTISARVDGKEEDREVISFRTEGITPIVSLAGPFNMNGINDYEVINHTSDLQVNTGAVSFTFVPSKINDGQGLLSKDSAGYDAGGHLTIYLLDDNTIRARLQSDRGTYACRNKNKKVELGQEYKVDFSFGQGGMVLMVNGEVWDTNDYEGSIENNTEPIVIGAMSDLSGDGEATPTSSYFKGIVKNIGVYDTRLD